MKSLPLNIVCVDLTKFNHVGIERLLVEYPFLKMSTYDRSMICGKKAKIVNCVIHDIQDGKDFDTINLLDLKKDKISKIFIETNSNKLIAFELHKSNKSLEFLLYGPSKDRSKMNRISETNIIISELFVDMLNNLNSLHLPKSQNKIDKTLEKVSKSGEGSLTENEKLSLTDDVVPFTTDSTMDIVCVDLAQFNHDAITKICNTNIDLLDDVDEFIHYKNQKVKKVFFDRVNKFFVSLNGHVSDDVKNLLSEIPSLTLPTTKKELSTDYILDKISMKGMESLSEKELNYLKSL